MTIRPDGIVTSNVRITRRLDLTDRAIRLPPNQQLIGPSKWPVIGERQPAPHPPNSLRVLGDERGPLELTLAELAGMPQTELKLDIHCVTRWSKLDMRFGGVLLADLLREISVPAKAQFVSFVSHSDRRHSSSMPLADALALDTLIALRVDGNPLGQDHGGPIRNLVPDRYFYKSVKWLAQLELLEDDRLGYWEAESGYHNQADPWREQRYMAPNLDKRTAVRLLEARDFRGHDLRSLDASQRDLTGLQAQGARLRDASFRKCRLRQADFSQANLSNGHFEDADLQGASFFEADLEGANFAGADLRSANFEGASLFGATFLETDSFGILRGARLDRSTRLPETAWPPLTDEQLEYVRQQLRQP